MKIEIETSNDDLVRGERVIRRTLPKMEVEYGWLRPFEGEQPVRPNRVKVVFSGHAGVWLSHGDVVREIAVRPGSAYVMAETPTSLRRIEHHSETIDLFPDMAFLSCEAEALGISDFVLRATLDMSRIEQFEVDPVLLGLATKLRLACLDPSSASAMDLSSLAALLVHQLISPDGKGEREQASQSGLRSSILRKIAEHVEENLAEPLTIGGLAGIAGLSTFHFAHEFKAAMGIAPWQYVQARRIERAKQLLQRTKLPVQDIIWSIGMENMSHFRRQFRRHVGVSLSDLRKVVN
ncbi:MAG: AraC family transcriptional regulator [Devosia sp.]